MNKIIIICGPTAVGKTRVGIELARKNNGEIISADSQQVWRGFDIGTAKANLRERSDVPHHLIDILAPDDHFDAARFVELADAAIKDISSRGKTPFVVGGTGMYIRMLVHGLCDSPPRDADFRKQIEAEIEKLGVPALHEKLRAVDPESALRFHPNDRTRIIRALEIFHLTGVPASKIRKSHKFKDRRYDATKIGLTIDRAELYRRIDERVDGMVKNGLIDEVRALLGRYDESCQPFQAVGYREIVDYIKGRITLEEAVRLTKQMSRRFAKRQLTWFKADPDIKWFDPSEKEAVFKAIDRSIAVSSSINIISKI